MTQLHKCALSMFFQKFELIVFIIYSMVLFCVVYQTAAFSFLYLFPICLPLLDLPENEAITTISQNKAYLQLVLLFVLGVYSIYHQYYINRPIVAVGISKIRNGHIF